MKLRVQKFLALGKIKQYKKCPQILFIQNCGRSIPGVGIYFKFKTIALGLLIASILYLMP